MGLQKQWLGKPSPRCNLERVYTCGAVEARYLGDPIVYTEMCPLTQMHQSVWGVSHNLGVVSLATTLPMVRHTHDSTRKD